MIQQDIFSFTQKKVSSVREVQELLAEESQQSCAVTVTSPEILQSQAVSLGRKSIFLDMEALDRIVEHEPSDLVLAVEPGVKIAHLNEKLSHHEQMFPVFSGSSTGLSLIDLLNLGDGGPLETGYGALRSNILGLHFVDHKGTLIKSGGRVVKNVTGYDVTKLLVGSPWFGVPVLAYLRLFARQPDRLAYKARGLSLSRALDFSQKLLATDLSPVILEIVEEDEVGKFTLFATVEGALQAVPLLARALERLATGTGLALSPFFDKESSDLCHYISPDRLETALFSGSSVALAKGLSKSRPGRLRLRPALNKFILERREGEDPCRFVAEAITEFRSGFSLLQLSPFESGQVVVKMCNATVGGIKGEGRIVGDVCRNIDPGGRFRPFVMPLLDEGCS